MVLVLRLSEFGERVGVRMVELLFVRERNYKRETKLLNVLLFIKGTLWKVGWLCDWYCYYSYDGSV